MSASSSKRKPLQMDPVSIERREQYYAYMAIPGNRERTRARHRKRYKENPEYYQAFTKDWQARNPNYTRDYYRDRRKTEKRPNGNLTRTPTMWRAQIEAEKIPLTKYCELCPPEDQRLATQRHHPDYNYPTIFFSVCQSCHTTYHRQEKKLAQTLHAQNMVEQQHG